MLKSLFRIIIAVFIFSLPIMANAHESRPLYIKITEVTENAYTVRIKVPPTVDYDNQPSLHFKKGCEPVSKKYSKMIHCDKPLEGTEVSITYPHFFPSMSTMIRFENLSGEEHTTLLNPEEGDWIIPLAESVSSVAKEYTVLGIEHILGGWDHLLFLICLLLIAGTAKRIMITVTGFTIAHSITLVLSALNLVRIPIPPVEVVIALSVVFLASEILHKRRDTLTWRFPIAVSASFGLLHGFGFAAVLEDIGLPQTELVTGLLFFNVGVEIGQLFFVLSSIFLIKLLMLTRLNIQNPIFEKAAAYSVGSIASFWMIERVIGLI